MTIVVLEEGRVVSDFCRTEVNNERALYLLKVGTVEKAKSLSDL